MYVLGAYVLLQFSWWTWLLSQQFALLKTYKIERAPELTAQFQREYNQKLYMLMGEGGVFLLLLALGFWMLLKAIHRRMELVRRQRNFLLSVTHELNSPLSAIRLNLETQLSRQLHPNDFVSLSTDALGETIRLQQFIDNLLTTARMDEQKLRLSIFSQPLSPTIAAQVATQKKFAGDRINATIADGITAHCDIAAVDIILRNLIENALKYSEDKIDVALSKNDDGVCLSVRDRGPGIAPADRQKIFDRFYRSGDEQTRHTQGSGLGLYISKKLAVDMQSVLLADNYPEGGVIFRLILKS
jgi:signal transduction histidine kinase